MKDLKTLPLNPAYTEIVSPSRFLQIFSEEPDNIARAEVIPGRLGDLQLGGKILVQRKKPVFEYRSQAGGVFKDHATISRTATRTQLLGEIGRIIKRLARLSRPATT